DDGGAYVLADRPRAGPAGARRAAAAASSNELRAPMPGEVVAVLAAAGDRVRTAQPLVTLEAMKMEHAVQAPADGVVAEVHCHPGQQVAEGELLVTLRVGGGEQEPA
ncbi:MAG: acetyl-CoA carboxylase biotin carboxyl carrier protein subunit, partial [Chloroflexi bacterium]|nr:acetyl-CoA carboxylase biotin carboxyl carrier protein subunit [Chloroflexota bacterium]